MHASESKKPSSCRTTHSPWPPWGAHVGADSNGGGLRQPAHPRTIHPGMGTTSSPDLSPRQIQLVQWLGEHSLLVVERPGPIPPSPHRMPFQLRLPDLLFANLDYSPAQRRRYRTMEPAALRGTLLVTGYAFT
ncbi:uncharacterized protein ATNIH1004_011807 [Aspergillus tanneri]|uniref:Uncharacterized protein n=1 Tax=Aspergillus tanneri TaxID=1220188 RepID=A0A5M9M4P0_9EURO|nr:uncharacterized protein ATNIH1004_011807 [Aspergillus tanneri]KAA8641671.1 hypothetical protein ATNIH1004_011807 [Aspergillus tanneri]